MARGSSSSEEARQAAAQAADLNHMCKDGYRHDLMVQRAFLLGVKDAASAPRARVYGAVMDSMRRLLAAKVSGMADAASAPMVGAPR